MEVRCRAETDARGNVVAYFGVSLDVTEQKIADQALRERERELAEAQRIGNIGHWRFRPGEEIVSASDQFWRIVGIDPARTAPTVESIAAAIHEDDRNRVNSQRAKAIEEKRPYTLEQRNVRPDGEIRYVRVEGRPEVDQDGNVVSVFGVTHDVTEQKRAEEALLDRERWLSTIVSTLDSADYGLTMQDGEGRIFYANGTVAGIGGFENPECLISQTWIELSVSQNPAFKPVMLAARQEAVEKGYSCVDFDWDRVDGSGVIRVEARSAPVPEGGLLILFLDVTEQRARERRHAELEQGLQQAQKMEALGQLAGATAHDINNLLHPIINFTKLTQKRVQEPELQHYLDRVLECGRRAADIVSDVLTFSRKSTGELKQVEVIELATRAVQFARDLTPPAVNLSSEVDVGTALGMLNETEFIQVIINLVQNASDAMGGEGEIVLKVNLVDLQTKEAENLDLKSGFYMKVSVGDQGQGISRGNLGRIFEPFFTTKQVGRGTGLGLAVVYGIIMNWNGGIFVDSKVGRGTTFDVFIPVTEANFLVKEALSA